MNDDGRLDERITGLVRSVERDVPPGLEAKVRAAAESGRTAGGILRPELSLPAGSRRLLRDRNRSRRRLRILALVPGAVAVGLAAFLLVPALRKPPAHRISEIRTEFEIRDKNIKIVFFQRPDFKLTQEE